MRSVTSNPSRTASICSSLKTSWICSSGYFSMNSAFLPLVARNQISGGSVEPDRGPVLVTVEYRIDPANREPFLAALEKISSRRRPPQQCEVPVSMRPSRR
jgi:hypothetical protein